MKLKEVYIVTAGEYSDFHIVGVFSEERMADEFIAEAIRLNTYDASSMGIETLTIDVPKQEQFGIDAVIAEDGTIIDTNIDSLLPARPPEFVKWYKRPPYLNVRVMTADKMRAIKVASETRTRILAANISWGDNKSLAEYSGVSPTAENGGQNERTE